MNINRKSIALGLLSTAEFGATDGAGRITGLTWLDAADAASGRARPGPSCTLMIDEGVLCA